MNVTDRIHMEHFYPHPPAAVWRALVDPELHARTALEGMGAGWPSVLDRLGEALDAM